MPRSYLESGHRKMFCFLSMRTFITTQRLRLGYEIPSVLGIVIRPAMHFRNFSGPVAMAGTDRRRPFQCRCTPWIPAHHPSALENGVEEIEDEQELNGKRDHRHGGDETVKAAELVEGDPVAVIEVAARHTGQSFVVHRPEDEVGAG